MTMSAYLRVRFAARNLIVLSLFTLFGLLSAHSVAQPLPVVTLEPGVDAAPFGQQLRYKKPYDDPVKSEIIFDTLKEFKTLSTSNIQFGAPDGMILILLRVQNVGDTQGSWILTTGRGSLKYFKLYELTDQSEHLLVDGTDLSQVKQNLQSYQAFSQEVPLSPGETKTYAIHFEPENVSNLPLKIQTYSTFFQARRANIALVSGVIGGVLILTFINGVFFWVTNKPEFLWLGLAEFIFAINTLHAEGYTTIYWLFNKPLLSLALGDILKCGFAAAMAQVARSFLKTRSTFLKTDIILGGLIGFCFLVCALQIGVVYYPSGFKAALHASSWIATSLIALYLPVVAFIAMRRLGAEYWPLIVAWGSLGLFILYGFVASLGVFENLPVNWHLAGPIGLFEAAMTTLALGLHVRKIQREKLTADAKLTTSLQEKFALSEKAKTLADQRALALATIHDQNSMLHATGHDSRQVVMALNGAIAHLEKDKEASSNSNLSNMLKASVNYLNDIISTTMSGAYMSDGSSQFVSLGLVRLDNLADVLEKIYQPNFKKKNLSYVATYPENLFFISDQALLIRALSNIVSNSHKFTEHGGVKIDVTDKSDVLKLVIHDTGPGIPPDVLARLNAETSKREKEDPTSEGTGSGLRYSTAIIKKLGGHIKIESGPDEHTSVTITLPLIRPLTQVDFETLADISSVAHFVDIDANSDTALITISKVAVTYDNSSMTRSKLAADFDLMLTKPLYAEVLEHPTLKIYL